MSGVERFLLSGDETREHWERVSGRRSPSHPVVRAFVDPKVELISRAIPRTGESTLLDVGCGNGFFTLSLARKWKVTGIDLSGRMLALNPHPRLLRGGAGRLPFEDGAFDVVFSSNMVYYLDRPLLAIREMARVTRRHLAIIIPNRKNPVMVLFSLLSKLERPALLFSVARLTSLLEEAGARVVLACAHGAIAANRTPERLLPLLGLADRRSPLGLYSIVIAEKA